ncbi:MAG: hydrogenase maturation nickel metallochaperone HypA [Acidobacteriota bacterium]|nr:hydrogenase maturation nickel metallochaperone HypA [Acidobacteriota bacterium]
MHEMTLLRDIFRKIGEVAETNGAERVVAVTLELGAMAHISADHLREHFTHESVGGVAEGARLTIIENPDPNDPNAQEIILRDIEITEEKVVR